MRIFSKFFKGRDAPVNRLRGVRIHSLWVEVLPGKE